MVKAQKLEPGGVLCKRGDIEAQEEVWERSLTLLVYVPNKRSANGQLGHNVSRCVTALTRWSCLRLFACCVGARALITVLHIPPNSYPRFRSQAGLLKQ